MKIAYKTTASATGGRDGHAATADGSLDVKLTVPKELGGPGGPGNNPEQLFATGYSACYLGAIKFVAAKEKITIASDARVTATVGIGPRDDGAGFGIDVDLEVSLPGLDRSVAEDLAKKAHVVCPYSHATRGNIDVRTKVV
jgi:osmotically inducible protein OsmC